MDMRGLSLIAGAVGLLAAPVAYKVMTGAERPDAPAEALAAADPATDPASGPGAGAPPAEPVRREVAGGAVFVSARD